MSTTTPQTPSASVRRRVRSLVIVSVTMITLGACASSNSDADTTASAASETIAQPAEASASTAPSDTAPSDTAAPDTSPPLPPSKDDVFTTAEATGKYPTFVKLVVQAGLADALRTGGPFTIAIPTEEAFAALPAETLTALSADKVELARVLKYHVVPAVVTPDPAASGPAATLEGSTLDVVFTETSTTINGANVLTAPRATANGAFIAIDQVLLPPQKK